MLTQSIWPYLIPVFVVLAFVIWGIVELFLWLVRWLWLAFRRKLAMAR